ncbi:MAG: ABC transporter permease [Clostridia bacterium]|nr:ABC transporter permease [Clostridia bacterium]
MGAVYKREMKAYFTSPIGYIVMAVMLFLMGLYFTYMFSAGYSDISFLFMSISSVSLFVSPIITMRLVSEDKKQKVDQVLLTAPVKLWKIVTGKFLAAFTLFMLPFTASVIYEIILNVNSADVSWVMFLSNLVGIALYGAAIIAIGLFISSMTESQIIAGIVGMVVSFFIMQIDYFATAVDVAWVSTACTYFSFVNRFYAFTSGQIDASNIVFFLSIAVLFIYLTTLAMDRKRWA